MIKSMSRSGIRTVVVYRSMLAGNMAYYPITPATYFPGEGMSSPSTQINKMPYSTETFSTLSATLTFSTGAIPLFNSRVSGYALQSGGASNKFSLVSDTNATFSNTNPTIYTSPAGSVPEVSGVYLSTQGSTNSSAMLVYTWTYATDTTSTSTSMQSYSSNFGISGLFALSTNGTNLYMGGGNVAGSYICGGIIKYASSSATSLLLFADTGTSPRARGQTAGAHNGSTAGYLAGGVTMPYQTFTTSILKLAYSNETISTLAGTLTTARAPVRTGIQHGVCAYYGGGKNNGASTAVSVTTVEKFSFATETSANLASASVNRDGYNSWNTL